MYQSSITCVAIKQVLLTFFTITADICIVLGILCLTDSSNSCSSNDYITLICIISASVLVITIICITTEKNKRLKVVPSNEEMKIMINDELTHMSKIEETSLN